MKLDLLFEGNSKVHLLLLLVLCYISFFLYNDSFFVNIMEARNFVTAREMIEKGNWLVPTMNGELRLAKPPLPTWITAAFGYFFGMNDISILRIPSGIMGCLMVLFMYRFTLSLDGSKSSALTSSIILTTSFYILYMSRTSTWDIYCHSFMLGAIWILFRNLKYKRNSQWVEFLLVGFLLGLSFLSKGPVAFFALFLPFLIAYGWVYGMKDFKQHWKPMLVCIVIFCIVSFWWPIYIHFAHPEELAAIAKLESVSWMNRHVRPFYYYWNFPIQSGIWTLVIVSALAYPYAIKNIEKKKEYKFAFIWTIASVVLLSCIPEKKERYLLPVLIPSAIIAGQMIQHLHRVFSTQQEKTADKWIFGINVWILIVISFLLPMLVFHFFLQSNQITLSDFSLFTLLSVFMFLFFLKSWITQSIRQYLLTAVAFMSVLIAFLLPNIQGLLNRNPDFKNIAEIKNHEHYHDLNFYSIGASQFRIELVYEVGKEVKHWNVKEDSNLPQLEPFIVFSSEPAIDLFSNEQLAKMKIEVIAYYDYNRLHQGKKKEHQHFKKYACLIHPIGNEQE